jgi:Flp pilus assembly protein TadB
MLHQIGRRVTSLPPLPDLLRAQDGRHPFWVRIIFLAAGAVCFVAGIVGWLIPVVTGIPFYAAGLVFLGLASDRTRRLINRLERRLAESTRRKLRRGLARVPGNWVRQLVHIPDEIT